MIIRNRNEARRVLSWPPLGEYPRAAEAVRNYINCGTTIYGDDPEENKILWAKGNERLRAKADSALNVLGPEKRAALKQWLSRTDEENAAAAAAHQEAIRVRTAPFRRMKT